MAEIRKPTAVGKKIPASDPKEYKRPSEKSGMKMENENSMRLVKFEILIQDIINAFSNSFRSSDEISPLEMVFDKDDLNEYGRIILDKVPLEVTEEYFKPDPWQKKYKKKDLSDEETKIKAALEYMDYCRNGKNEDVGYRFVFWCLMILGVDDSDADEKLSLICDFAKMFRIKDDELVEIAQVVKSVYSEQEVKYEFKTLKVNRIFGEVIRMYEA